MSITIGEAGALSTPHRGSPLPLGKLPPGVWALRWCPHPPRAQGSPWESWLSPKRGLLLRFKRNFLYQSASMHSLLHSSQWPFLREESKGPERLKHTAAELQKRNWPSEGTNSEPCVPPQPSWSQRTGYLTLQRLWPWLWWDGIQHA